MKSTEVKIIEFNILEYSSTSFTPYVGDPQYRFYYSNGEVMWVIVLDVNTVRIIL